MLPTKTESNLDTQIDELRALCDQYDGAGESPTTYSQPSFREHDDNEEANKKYIRIPGETARDANTLLTWTETQCKRGPPYV